MIYTDSQLKEKIVRMIESFENEVVEFKEARTNYSFNDIGKYFSALSNEANLRGLQEAWLDVYKRQKYCWYHSREMRKSW